MATSPEYPDLAWVEPRAWSSGRPSGPPLWIVIHVTDGSEGLRSAEDGAAYDARREDGTSTHYFHDQDTTVQCVRTGDRANAARNTGNRRGIHHEICGKAAQDLTHWHDPASMGALRRAARQVARDAAKWGIPLRRLSVAEVKNYTPGICGHVDISNAFRESDHTDPGTAFPWTEFLALVYDARGDDMPLTAGDLTKIIDAMQGVLESGRGRDAVSRAVWTTDGILAAPGQPAPGTNPDGTAVNTHWGADTYVRQIHDLARSSRDISGSIAPLVRKLAESDAVDEKALASALAPLVAEAIVARMPDVSQEEVTTAVRQAFAEAFALPA